MNSLMTQYPILWPLTKEILVGTVLLIVVLIFHGSAINHVIMRFERQTTKKTWLIKSSTGYLFTFMGPSSTLP